MTEERNEREARRGELLDELRGAAEELGLTAHNDEGIGMLVVLAHRVNGVPEVGYATNIGPAFVPEILERVMRINMEDLLSNPLTSTAPEGD